MNTFEVELRALLSKDQYESLLEYFNQKAKGVVDDAETYTFLTKDKNIKVKNLLSSGKAKITVKNGAEYKQHVTETELPIDPKDVEKAVNLVTALGFGKHIPSKQKRINFIVDGITVSLKHETNWGYHIEAEIVVDSESKLEEAKKTLQQFFKHLDLTPMTEEETKNLVNSVLKKYSIDAI